MSGTYDYAIEKDLISGMILSLLHENTLTRTIGFEAVSYTHLDVYKRQVLSVFLGGS